MLFHVFHQGSLNDALPAILGAPYAEIDAAQREGRSLADVGADHERSLETIHAECLAVLERAAARGLASGACPSARPTRGWRISARSSHDG